MKLLTPAVAAVSFAFGFASCHGGTCSPPPPPPPACAGIVVPPIPPSSGSQTLCVLPSECREDTMGASIATTFCNDKSGGWCGPGNLSCSGKCGGTVGSSGLVASACTWDRNSECLAPGGGKGGNCTCAWSIPAGSSLSCGCACQ